MTKTSGSTFRSVDLKYHHSPTAVARREWRDAEAKRAPPFGARPMPRGLIDVPDVVVLSRATTKPSELPYTTMYSPFPSEDYSPITDSEAVTATQRAGLFVFVRRRSRPFESFNPDTQSDRLVDFACITLQTIDKETLQNEIVGTVTYQNVTVGVYSAAYDPVVKKMGQNRLETHPNMDVTVGRPQGAWVITVCEPEGDGDGKKMISKSGENINFWATVLRGDKGHYTKGGTLVFQDGLAWYGLEAVQKKEEGTSHDRSEAQLQYWQEEVGEKGQADRSSGAKVPEEREASFSEKDRDWSAGDEETHGQSTNRPPQSVWRRWFGGRPRSHELPQSTKRQ